MRSARFRTFVNSDDDDPNVVFVPERGQHRPAYQYEKAAYQAEKAAYQTEKEGTS